MLGARTLLRKRVHAAAPSSWHANNAVQPATLDVVNGGVKMYLLIPESHPAMRRR